MKNGLDDWGSQPKSKMCLFGRKLSPVTESQNLEFYLFLEFACHTVCIRDFTTITTTLTNDHFLGGKICREKSQQIWI